MVDEFLDEKINLFSSINEKDMNGLSALEKLLSYTVSEEEANSCYNQKISGQQILFF